MRAYILGSFDATFVKVRDRLAELSDETAQPRREGEDLCACYLIQASVLLGYTLVF